MIRNPNDVAPAPYLYLTIMNRQSAIHPGAVLDCSGAVLDCSEAVLDCSGAVLCCCSDHVLLYAPVATAASLSINLNTVTPVSLSLSVCVCGACSSPG